MASMARSGETLMLKILASHSKIKVVHNLEEIDNPKKDATFIFLKSYSKKEVIRYKSNFSHYGLRSGDLLLLKQGVWEHKYPFKGFILSRNPFSIYTSLKLYDKDDDLFDIENNFWFENKKRLIRWSKDIDFDLYENLKDKKPIEQFCMFYNRRMGNLLNTGLPIIKYEDLVSNAEETIQKVCDILVVEYENQLLDSHLNFEYGKIGHGKNDLSKPINSDSIHKYVKVLNRSEIEYIKENCKTVYSNYGYYFSNKKLKWN